MLPTPEMRTRNGKTGWTSKISVCVCVCVYIYTEREEQYYRGRPVWVHSPRGRLRRLQKDTDCHAAIPFGACSGLSWGPRLSQNL